jgi:hypothetical protein
MDVVMDPSAPRPNSDTPLSDFPPSPRTKRPWIPPLLTTEYPVSGFTEGKPHNHAEDHDSFNRNNGPPS